MSQSESHTDHESMESEEQRRHWEGQTGEEHRPVADSVDVNVGGSNNTTIIGPVEGSTFHHHHHYHHYQRVYVSGGNNLETNLPRFSSCHHEQVGSEHNIFAISTASASCCDSPESGANFAEELTKHSQKGPPEVGHSNIFMVPLEKGTDCKKGMHCSYSFGEKCRELKAHKVIMLVGATGAGKSTLINRMINYILGVKWEDDFRFKLVYEHGTGAQSQAHSQTQITSSYTIYRNKHHKIPYTLTIIDTPGFGDTRGIERDRAIIEQIRQFFSHPEPHGVDHIDAVGFVVQASQSRLTTTQMYIFDSTLSLFGKDVEPNIILLVTFWDGSEPAVLGAIKEARIPHSEWIFKFDNAALFAKNKDNTAESDSDDEVSLSKNFWRRGMKETKRFFQTVSELEAKSLSLSKGVLDTRKRLEQKVAGLQTQCYIYRDRIGELRKEQEVLERCQTGIEDRLYEAQVIEHEKIVTEAESMNCGVCQYTCHYQCTENERNTRTCDMMDWSGNCMVCPNRCSWSDHIVEKNRHKYTEKNVMKRVSDIEWRYNDATSKRLTVEEVVGKLELEMETLKDAEKVLIEEIHALLQKLEENALKPTPISLFDYIDLLIYDEKQAATAGWQERVKTLQSYQDQHNLLLSIQSTYREKMEKLNTAWNLVERNMKALPNRDQY